MDWNLKQRRKEISKKEIAKTAFELIPCLINPFEGFNLFFFFFSHHSKTESCLNKPFTFKDILFLRFLHKFNIAAQKGA